MWVVFDGYKYTLLNDFLIAHSRNILSQSGSIIVPSAYIINSSESY
ncbi:hypothetical protein CLIT_22c00020 [Peptoclostridium litorale DSM 5388]|uniref:Uncharacterized protein n=1 Tax=Peptoclostridium litorale DSM 5388 TaxID=1121324 RepID=A0A069RJA9_PEPLI|nr:hypothetical protein CLIT_22c00020 [Peptoclostridium litorale DSM 5388]